MSYVGMLTNLHMNIYYIWNGSIRFFKIQTSSLRWNVTLKFAISEARVSHHWFYKLNFAYFLVVLSFWYYYGVNYGWLLWKIEMCIIEFCDTFDLFVLLLFICTFVLVCCFVQTLSLSLSKQIAASL